MPNTLIREQLTINLPGEPTSLDAYTVRPSGNTPCPTVIVAMELFGLNDHVRDISDRLAAQGYAVIAPNFYHRTLPAASLPFGEEGRQEGFVHLRKLTREQVLADVAAVLRVIESRPDASGRVGVLGFSMGGHIAYLTATQFPVAACACFYGGWIANTDIPMSQPP
jgi:carboxymethylenebutenolidase